MDDDFMALRFQVPQPRDELPILCRQTLMMIIGYNEKRADAHTATNEFRSDLVCKISGRRRDVVQRNNHKVSCGARSRDQWQELSGNHRSHIFKISPALSSGESAKNTGCPTLLSHTHNGTKLAGSHGHDGEARLTNKLHFLELRNNFDLSERNGSTQRFARSKIDRAPIALCCSRVGIGSVHNFGDADHSFVLAAMIEENFVTFSHLAQIVSRCVVPNAC